jgi:hypothetical protein
MFTIRIVRLPLVVTELVAPIEAFLAVAIAVSNVTMKFEVFRGM